ncbi:MAG: hypothetical protein IK062_04370 [Selenomonadaceae bacterium]|nr:hypothetical protein [Selenomonadaceae bacterium]
MYEVIILGAGGTGREIAEMFEEVFDEKNFRLKGFLSDVSGMLDNYEIDVPVLGTIKDYEIQENDRFILAIGDVQGRRKIAENILERGGKFINFIHPLAKIFRSAKIGQGVIIFPFGYAGANSDIGDFCFINSHAGSGHDVKLGAFSEQAPYSVLAGGVQTGEECFFALHAAVGPKVILGNRVVISQGSVTQKNQPDDSVIVGTPGKRLRKIGNMF